MKNITVAVPTETWRVARLWCAQNDTSLSEMVSGMLDIMPRLKPKGTEIYKTHHRRALALENNERIGRIAPAVQPPAPDRECTTLPSPAAQPLQTGQLPANPAATPPGETQNAL